MSFWVMAEIARLRIEKLFNSARLCANFAKHWIQNYSDVPRISEYRFIANDRLTTQDTNLHHITMNIRAPDANVVFACRRVDKRSASTINLHQTVGWISEAHPPITALIGGGCAALIHPTEKGSNEPAPTSRRPGGWLLFSDDYAWTQALVQFGATCCLSARSISPHHGPASLCRGGSAHPSRSSPLFAALAEGDNDFSGRWREIKKGESRQTATMHIRSPDTSIVFACRRVDKRSASTEYFKIEGPWSMAHRLTTRPINGVM
jgi:hypothetical protein